MKTRSLLVLIVVSAPMALFTFVSAGLADPPSTLVSPPNHRHFVMTTNGPVPVGPQICQNPNLRLAFNQFHYNVHHSVVPGIGDIPTLGPQDGAPGLNNDVGSEVFGVPGCG